MQGECKVSENRDLARSLLAAARRRANRFTRQRESFGGQKSSPSNSGQSDGLASGYHDPQLFNESLADLVAQRGWQGRIADSDLFLRWGDLVGNEIATHVQPISFSSGVLTVSAASTAWATQLRLIEGELVKVMSAGGFVVTELVIKGPAAPSWRKGGWSAKGGRGPRDTYG